jgi:hypothetical protein
MVIRGFLLLFLHIILRCWLLLLIVSSLHGFRGITTFVPRAQGVDSVSTMLSWMRYAQAENEQDAGALIALVPKYTHSIHPCAISTYLFNSTMVNITGSQVPDRSSLDILADYFGLPSDYQSVLSVNPFISSIQVDINGFFQLSVREHNSWYEELYFALHAPIVHSRFDLRLRENIVNDGVNFYPAGYMGKGDKRIARSQLTPDAKTYLQGEAVFGDMLEPLGFGKISGAHSLTDLADVELVFGWQGVSDKGLHIGLSAFVTVPTGNASRAEYLFEPFVGNGHHWGLGIGLIGYMPVWQACDGRSYVVSWQARFGHLFESFQRRSFDLKNNGRGSRYMLLETIGPAVDNIVQIPAGTLLQQQYQGLLVPAINKTTLDCRISVDMQAEGVIALSIIRNCWCTDVGYNIWSRSKERIESRAQLQSEVFGLKGDASLYGFVPGGTSYYLALNATQHNATLQGGQGAGNANFANLNADNSTAAGNGLTQLTPADSIALGIPIDSAHGSNPPLLLTNADIDEASALVPHAMSHKIFVQGSYRGQRGYIGIGTEIEFVTRDQGVRAAASQWGVWIHAGISY